MCLWPLLSLNIAILWSYIVFCVLLHDLCLRAPLLLLCSPTATRFVTAILLHFILPALYSLLCTATRSVLVGTFTLYCRLCIVLPNVNLIKQLVVPNCVQKYICMYASMHRSMDMCMHIGILWFLYNTIILYACKYMYVYMYICMWMCTYRHIIYKVIGMYGALNWRS